MTRQIALAIFLAATLTMLGAGALTYAVARRTLLDAFDRSLISHAVAALPGEGREAARPPEGDRFVAEDALGRTVARSHPLVRPAAPPKVLSRAFTSGGGAERLRTLVLELETAQGPLRIVYSSPAAEFDRLGNRLAWTIAGAIAVGGAITAATATLISRRVTRPLLKTADALAAVDDAHLDQRVRREDVPVELRPVIDRLNEMLARLEAAFAGQRRFLADAAHELRTPVAASRAALEIALSRPRSAEHLRGVLDRSLRNTLQMGEIVEAMLDCVRTGSERQPTAAPIDAAALLDECVEQVRPLAGEKSQALRVDLDRPLLLESDAFAIRTIVRNLLSNAISHTPGGGEIAVTAKATPAGGLSIQVADNGGGIPPEHLRRIYEPFYRVEHSRSDRGHLGLGLYIVQRHIARLDGRIEVASTVGKGTTFSVHLPSLNTATRTGEPADESSRPRRRELTANDALMNDRVTLQD